MNNSVCKILYRGSIPLEFISLCLYKLPFLECIFSHQPRYDIVAKEISASIFKFVKELKNNICPLNLFTLSGPMLSAGMCTEVFQFEVSAASGAIVEAHSGGNISEAEKKSSSKTRNRRILHPLPYPEPSHNVSGEHRGRSEEEDLKMKKNASSSSMVVSVLFDPRDGDVIGTKSLSRIFVVVLMDSVRYVTYSCMLPFKGAASHLVTA